MVDHHRRVVGDQWPVLAPDTAWARRREDYAAWLADGSGFILVAHDQSGVPIGYLACRLVSAGATFDLGELRGDVDSLVTAERARGRGVGTALLNACREQLKRRGARYWSIGVVEANTRAVDLYQRLGFRPFTRSLLGEINGSDEDV